MAFPFSGGSFFLPRSPPVPPGRAAAPPSLFPSLPKEIKGFAFAKSPLSSPRRVFRGCNSRLSCPGSRDSLQEGRWALPDIAVRCAPRRRADPNGICGANNLPPKPLPSHLLSSQRRRNKRKKSAAREGGRGGDQIWLP